MKAEHEELVDKQATGLVRLLTWSVKRKQESVRGLPAADVWLECAFVAVQFKATEDPEQGQLQATRR